MKRILFVAALLGLLFSAATAAAQYREKAVLLTLGAGWSSTQLKNSGEKISGSAAGFTLEKVLEGGKFNLGFTFSWLSAADDVVLEGDTTPSPVSFSSMPFMITGRWNFLNSRFAGNLGLGFGFYNANLFLYEGTIEERKSTETGISVTIPLQFVYFVDPDVYLQASYIPAIMTASSISDDLAHNAILAIGFQWGGKKD